MKNQMQDEEAILEAKSLIEKGYNKEQIVKGIKGGVLASEEIYEVAKCRIKARDKFGELGNKLFFDDWGLRYSTPRSIAEYRASRLECEAIADISCGVGSQLIFFAKVCDRVYGVELDHKRALYATLNAQALGLKNVTIWEGDALNDDIIKEIKDAQVFFSDPSRPPGEKVRTIENLEPNPLQVFEKYKGIGDIVFELPPQMPPSRVPFEGEKEYTSFNFKLNRLALYTGGLASCQRSAISIPSYEKVHDGDETGEFVEGSKVNSFLYEVDNTVIKAELLPNLLGKLKFDARILQSGKRTLLTSDEDKMSAFLRKFKVEDVTGLETSTIKDALRKTGAGKVTLRFSLDPSEYWKVRNELERGLKGEKWIQLFKIEDKAILTSEL